MTDFVIAEMSSRKLKNADDSDIHLRLNKITQQKLVEVEWAYLEALVRELNINRKNVQKSEMLVTNWNAAIDKISYRLPPTGRIEAKVGTTKKFDFTGVHSIIKVIVTLKPFALDDCTEGSDQFFNTHEFVRTDSSQHNRQESTSVSSKRNSCEGSNGRAERPLSRQQTPNKLQQSQTTPSNNGTPAQQQDVKLDGYQYPLNHPSYQQHLITQVQQVQPRLMSQSTSTSNIHQRTPRQDTALSATPQFASSQHQHQQQQYNNNQNSLQLQTEPVRRTSADNLYHGNHSPTTTPLPSMRPHNVVKPTDSVLSTRSYSGTGNTQHADGMSGGDGRGMGMEAIMSSSPGTFQVQRNPSVPLWSNNMREEAERNESQFEVLQGSKPASPDMSGMGSIMSTTHDRIHTSNPIPSVVRMSVNDYAPGGDFTSPKSPHKQPLSPINSIMRSVAEQPVHQQHQQQHQQQHHHHQQQQQQAHSGRQPGSNIGNNSGNWNGDLHQNSNISGRQPSNMPQIYQPSGPPMAVSQQFSSYNGSNQNTQLHRPQSMDPNVMSVRYVSNLGGPQLTDDGYYMHNGAHQSAVYSSSAMPPQQQHGHSQSQGHWDRPPYPNNMDGMYGGHVNPSQQQSRLTTSQSVDPRGSPHNRNQQGDPRRPLDNNWYPGPQTNRYDGYSDMQQQTPTPANMTQYRWFLTIPTEMQGDSEEEQKRRRDYIHTFFERQPDGAWLVRYNHRKHQFVLSILFGGLVLHMNIASQGNEYVLDNHRFPSIPALTDYYQSNNISGKIATPLTMPIPCIRTDTTNYVLVE
ncbi:hypothetical protein SARC_04605 [Sphaeroforma arctica JP610]|uniref:SH2 domain-containing protein n=1 Tax=Sphaeroforma arctica JP610 TaxID=667725 RepID=A0A0L0G4I8_9EUKA|nr:hypothetical protein SARC_04605 [Sphaeroforma arctica JP610]KNC83133.1 hypothetical protein SARC_04605 [Sphaeroforma arctica JP610]|eukprot:XP_014157035.1 hypothetical protein SARC_04605 [Sphaeroforma arctica JP610]